MATTFRAVVEQAGRTATGIEVPAEVVEALASGKKPAVKVTINGFTYQSTLGSMGGRSMIPVSAANRESAGVAAGDEVEVTLELDTGLREVTVPGDFATALAGEKAAKTFFDSLSYSQRRWFVDGIESAKKPETRQRRIDAAIERLREGRGQR